ncbi:MAG: hypothetical protein GXO89_01825 [Chlorobi bacterium]|nr:hypothetical protein [Chlorobiota bacterium]
MIYKYICAFFEDFFDYLPCNGLYSYDCSKGPGQVYCGVSGHKEIAPGIWGMIAGDANADKTVNSLDKTSWTLQSGTSGYKSADFDLNGEANNIDKNEKWEPNIGEGSQVPE